LLLSLGRITIRYLGLYDATIEQQRSGMIRARIRCELLLLFFSVIETELIVNLYNYKSENI
jgi:hypothetical protein